jgi:hypothetical protein
MKKELLNLRKNIESINIDYTRLYEDIYNDIYNIVIDYENNTQDFSFDYLFEDIIDYDSAEDRAKWELENGGLIRLYYFLGDANLNNSLFKINGYGNLEDIYIDDLTTLKEDILDNIDLKLKEC